MATTTTTANKAFAPDVTLAARDTLPDALLLSCSTVLAEIEGDAPSVRVAYAPEGTVTFTAEGADITPQDPTLSEMVIQTAKLTQMLKVSRELYAQTATAGTLASSVSNAVTKAGNAAFLKQVAPTAPATTPPAGLLNVTGIVSGSALATSLDSLVDLVATLEGNGSVPSHIIIDPVGWAKVCKLKVATGNNQSLVGAGVAASERRLLGLPVIVSPSMTASSALVLDAGVIGSAMSPLRLAASDQLYFNSDNIALRATWRIGWNVLYPNRIGKLAIT